MADGLSLVSILCTDDDGTEAMQAKFIRAMRGDTSDGGKEYRQDKIKFEHLDCQLVSHVAVSSRFVGLLLVDGRVARFKFGYGEDIKPKQDDNNDEAKQEEPSLLEKSDEAYARQLQEQYNRGEFHLGPLVDQEDNSEAESLNYEVFSPSDYNSSPAINPWGDAFEGERSPSPSIQRLYSPSPPGRRYPPVWYETAGDSLILGDPMDIKDDEFDEELLAAGNSGVRRRKVKRKKKKTKFKMKAAQQEQKKGDEKKWPTVGELEWIRTEPSGLKFSSIAALHSEFLLIERDSRKLYSWPCTEADSSLAVIHPLTGVMWTEDEEVSIFGACQVRATVVMKSGKITTFYDQILRDCDCGGSPSLVSELSHSANHMAGLTGETIIEVKASDLLTAVVTDSGKVLWWGLTPTTEIIILRDRKKSRRRRRTDVKVGCRVKLERGPPGFPGSLIYTSSGGLGPRIGQMLPLQSWQHWSESRKVRVAMKPRRSGNTSEWIEEVEADETNKDYIEQLEVRDCVFLDKKEPAVGTVVGFDGSNAVVKLDENSLSMLGKKSKTTGTGYKIFKVSELECLNHPEETETRVRRTSWHGHYQIQHTPLCLISPELLPPAEAVGSVNRFFEEKPMSVSGCRAITVSATDKGVYAIIVRECDNRAFFLTSFGLENFGSRWRIAVSTGYVDEEQGGRILGGGASHEAETVLANEAKLNREFVEKEVSKTGGSGSVVRRKRTHGETEVREKVTVELKPCIVNIPDTTMLLVLDGNGGLFPRYLGCGLNNCPVDGVPIIKSLAVGERPGNDPDSKTRVYFAVSVLKNQELMPAISSGSTDEVERVLMKFEWMDATVPVETTPSKKKVKVKDDFPENDQGAWSVASAMDRHFFVPDVVSEKMTGNRNVLHACCMISNHTEEMKKKTVKKFDSYHAGKFEFHSISVDPRYQDYSFSELRWQFYQSRQQGEEKTEEEMVDEEKDNETETCDRIVDLILKSPALQAYLPKLLSERDVMGRTPFLTAVSYHNYQTANSILSYVEQYCHTHASSDLYQQAIVTSSFSSFSPLHFLSMPGISRCPLAHKVLHVTRLPKLYTASQLLRLYQIRYPSAFRTMLFKNLCEDEATDLDHSIIEEVDWMLFGGTKDGLKALQLKIAEKEKEEPDEEEVNTGFRNRARARRRGNQEVRMEGVVFFGDVAELRHALINMHNFSIYADLPHSPGSSFSSVQHLLQVQCVGDELILDDPDCVQTIKKKLTHQTVRQERLRCELTARLLDNQSMASSFDEFGDTALSWLFHKRALLEYQLKGREEMESNLALAAQKKLQEKEGSKLAGQIETMLVDMREEEKKEREETIEEIERKSQACSTMEEEQTERETEAGNEAVDDDTSKTVEPQPEVSTEKPPVSEPKPDMPQESESTETSNRFQLKFGDTTVKPFSRGLPFPVRITLSKTDINTEPLPVSPEYQLASNWPCLASTVNQRLFDPTQADEENCKDSKRLDAFTVQLVTDSNDKLINSVVSTLIKAVLRATEKQKINTTKNLVKQLDSSEEIIAARRLVRSLVRFVALLESSYDPTEAPPSIGPSNADKALKRCRIILSTFSFLSVLELATAADAVIIPVRLGSVKPHTIASLNPNSISSLTSSSFSAMRLAVERRRRGPGEIDARILYGRLRSANELPDPEADLERCYMPVNGLRLCHGLAHFDSDHEGMENDDDGTTTADSAYWADPLPRRRAPNESLMNDVSSSDWAYSSDENDESRTTVQRRERRQRRARSSLLTEQTYDEDNFNDINPLDHPFSWSVDGRGIGGLGTGTVLRNPNVSPVRSFSTTPTPTPNPAHVPSLRFGTNYLTRMFTRMVKETMDVLHATTGDQLPPPSPPCDYPPGQEREPSEEGLMKLRLPPEACDVLCSRTVSLLEVTWQWLATVLDVLETQLVDGTRYNTQKYARMLRADREERPRGHSDPFGGGKEKIVQKGASPPEYLIYLLRAHTGEADRSLPVLDVESYEHVVYVLDALLYSLNKWQHAMELISSQPFPLEDEVIAWEPSDASRPNTLPVSGQEFFQRTESLSDSNKAANDSFFGQSLSPDSSNRNTSSSAYLHTDIPLVQKPHLLQPFASREALFGLKKPETAEEEELRLMGPKRPGILASARKQELLVPPPCPLMVHWSVETVTTRWRTAIDLFSQLFFADGPGAERANFLSQRAGFAGRMARFRRQVAQQRQGGGRGGNTYTSTAKTLSFEVRRNRLLEDVNRIIEGARSERYTAVRCKFIGEEGSGPGVTRGFFAAVANELKKPDKFPAGTAALFFEPGKKPQQAHFYAPCPFHADTPRDKELKPQRDKIFYFIGRFLGYCLWFHHTIPFMLSRHVAKYLIGREIAWHDLAFYNVDLFEGLRRLLIDAEEKKMSKEEFQSTYCLCFEAPISGKIIELIPNGSQIPVTPERVKDYVRHYAVCVMFESVKGELSNMRQGMQSVINTDLLSGLTAEDFQMLLAGGIANVSLSRLKSVITFNNSHSVGKEAFEQFKTWFWQIVAKMNTTQRQQLLYFATGSGALPAQGDASVDPTTQGPTAITIDVVRGSTTSLPMASTCGQRMTIPLYASKKLLKDKLLQAIQCQIYGLG